MGKRTSYERHKDRVGRDQAEKSESGRDIAPLPEVGNPLRKSRAAKDFRFFCESYFPDVFVLQWSEDHLRIIAKIEQAVLEGGLFAMAMPRGSGKTTLCEVACVWATAYGHREFVCLVGSDESSAEHMLGAIKQAFECNDILAEDFPEVCYPIACLDGIANRCKGQLCNGERTHISWTSKEVVYPTIPNSRASGAIIRVAGITGRIRGMKYVRADGKAVRPCLVIIDDPQTDESARSPSQCATREATIAGAILGLAGPGKKISGIMPCTVIYPNDLADRVLDRNKHPQWQGERTKMVYEWPHDEAKWERYRELRAEGLRTGAGVGEATAYYESHRVAMDEGARVAWEARYNPGELSAIQHAINLRMDQGDHAFFAEYQNEPLPEHVGVDDLDPEALAERCLGTGRGVVPLWATRVTAFIDVQQKLLYWVVAAWGEDFSGCVIDYGAFPDQPPGYFTAQDARRTLGKTFPGAGIEGAIFAGLEATALALIGRDWLREDGAHVRIERCLVDANFMTDTVYEFCRRSQFAGVVMPRWGKSIGAAAAPFDRWEKKPGERHGFKWIIQKANKRNIAHVLVETNGWKSFVASRLQTPIGDKGALTLWGRKGQDHRMFIDHLTAETRIRSEGPHGVVDEWKSRPDRRENHWWDCVVGAAVAASVQGTQFAAVAAPKPARVRKSMSEMQRERRLANSRRAG